MCDFGRQKIHVIHEKLHHTPRITVWIAMSSHGLLERIFFEVTVNSELYLRMLRNISAPHLLATGLPLQTPWFMQDGARPHTAVEQSTSSPFTLKKLPEVIVVILNT
jgi:hypothetical protein